MKQTSYKNNFPSEVLGIITTKNRSPWSRANYIYVASELSKCPFGYAAAITNVDCHNDKVAVVDDLSLFTDGDVVLLNSKGEIVFLYEIGSQYNAIFATECCNHRCIMCPQPPITHEKDKTEFNLKLISLFDKSTAEVGITGGEPTMIGDNLFVLIKAIQKHLPNAPISLLSNGVKFAERDYAMKLAQCKHFDLQVDVPLFSDIADEHNAIVGAKTFYKTVQGLYNLALFRQKIGLRIVVHKKTYRRLPQLADFIYHNFPFVNQVAFLQMETIGLATKNIEELWIDPYEYNKELREAVLLLNDRGVKTLIYNAQLCILPEEIRNFAVNSISDWKDSYLPLCTECVLRDRCGGLFATNGHYISEHIKPITKSSGQPGTSDN